MFNDLAMMERTSSMIANVLPRAASAGPASSHYRPASIGDSPIIRYPPLNLKPLLRGRIAGRRRQPVDDGVGAFGCGIERLFERAARSFERRRVGLSRHAERIADDGGAVAERQVDRRAVPIV